MGGLVGPPVLLKNSVPALAPLVETSMKVAQLVPDKAKLLSWSTANVAAALLVYRRALTVALEVTLCSVTTEPVGVVNIT